jgi:hypothetical protein
MEYDRQPADMSVETAIEQWGSYRSLFDTERYESLDASLDPALKQLRDHDDFSDTGLQAYLVKLATFSAKNEDTSEGQACAEIIDGAYAAIGAKNGEWLARALQDSSLVADRAKEAAELAAIEDPAVAKAFIKEVMADKPLFGSKPLGAEELAEMTDFSDSEPPRADKTVLAGKFIYQIFGSFTARGVYQVFTRSLQQLDGKTPRQIIDNGTDEDYQQLYQWALAGRSQGCS